MENTHNITPKKISDFAYTIEKTGSMNVPVKIIASEKLMDKMLQDNCITQGIHVATLPGIKGWSVMMPDAHQGYGFSIGGVAAIDCEHGCISPGGIGFDINCGVRLLASNLKKEDVQQKIDPLLNALFRLIPPGVGAKSLYRLTDKELEDVLRNGATWAVKANIGLQEDLECCEESGTMPEADPTKVSQKAKSRGRGQLGTLGAGNHFLEIQYVEEIFDQDIAKTFGITEVGQVVIMIHTGSRGLGHQVCSDYLRKMEEAFPDIIASLPEKDLIYAPAKSPLAKEYYGAMCAAANFAWTNRHVIGHQVRKAFKSVFPESNLQTIYDVAHNIAKKEEHVADGKPFTAWVHRKGATRAFGPKRKEIPERYRNVGQPIFIPGSMGTASYVLVGTEKAMQESFGSTAHGAGRMMSRVQANKNWSGEEIKADLAKEHIIVKAKSWRGISEEAPLAYKDVDEVVKVSHDAGIGSLVAKLKPMGVVKG
ncbi:MAG: RtcB family protein [Candidatus Woesearchaeota archaeon]|nr:MAG: RtcB family protein [Candidatus Woesearchaeota archaeon]